MAAMMGFGGFGKKAPPKKVMLTKADFDKTKRDQAGPVRPPSLPFVSRLAVRLELTILCLLLFFLCWTGRAEARLGAFSSSGELNDHPSAHRRLFSTRSWPFSAR